MQIPNRSAGSKLKKISASCIKSDPTEFFCPAVFSSRIVTSFVVLATSISALVNLWIPFSSPDPLWLPKCVTRYGIPILAHRSTSLIIALIDFSWLGISGVERFGRYGIWATVANLSISHSLRFFL